LNGGERSIPANPLFWLANFSGEAEKDKTCPLRTQSINDQRAGTDAYLPDLAFNAVHFADTGTRGFSRVSSIPNKRG
jgi:hypothetical protein